MCLSSEDRYYLELKIEKITCLNVHIEYMETIKMFIHIKCSLQIEVDHCYSGV